MSFTSGSTALTICTLSGPLPEDYLSRLAEHPICKLDNLRDEAAYGWAGYTHLQAPVDEENAICGGFLHLQLVKAERRIPGATLKDACRRQELAYMRTEGRERCCSKEKKRIRDEAHERLLMHYPPITTSVPVIVPRTWPLGSLYAGSASQKQLDNLIALFHKSLSIEAVPLSVNELMRHWKLGSESDLPILSFCGASSKDADPAPARDFLTWLWYFAETSGAKLKVDLLGDFEAMIEGPLTFAASEAKGALLTVVKKGGCPQASAEAKAALQAGKKLKKAKLVIAHGKQVWSGVFDADSFSFSGLNLPEGEEMELHSRFEERVSFIDDLSSALYCYFRRFVEDVRKPETLAKIKQWAQDRESY